jgi:hypothetical protein
MSILFQWVCMVSMQILTQVSYAPGGMAAAAAPSQTMLTMGVCMIVAYLDFKMRTTPQEIPADYYGIEDTAETETPAGQEEPEQEKPEKEGPGQEGPEKEEVDV